MTFRPTPKQALLIWTMIAGETDELRRPLRSKAKASGGPLIAEGFLIT